MLTISVKEGRNSGIYKYKSDEDPPLLTSDIFSVVLLHDKHSVSILVTEGHYYTSRNVVEGGIVESACLSVCLSVGLAVR